MSSYHFGPIPTIHEGYIFSNRLELSISGVHRPRQAGICGSQKLGAESIVLSGGYEDDEDKGDIIIYTGHGGRDLNTGKQVAHQELIRQNLALALSCQKGLPVRVIRGARQDSIYAPKEGYRYDGLYRVDNYWRERGRSGYYVWRFRLVKIRDIYSNQMIKEDRPPYGKTKRIESTIQRIIRDTELAREVKRLYDFTCQICQLQLQTNAGPYAEAAHIKPLGAPHHGPDDMSNLLCLCPNHHVLFDFGGFAILEDYDLIGIEGKLYVKSNHKIDSYFLQYHHEHFYEESW